MVSEILHQLTQTLIDPKTNFLISELMDVLGVNFCVIDTEGNYLVQNKILAGAINKETLKAPEIDQASWQDCLDVMNSQQKRMKEEYYNGKYFMSIKYPIIVSQKSIGIIVLGIDITERKKIEKELAIAKEKAEEANAAKTEFLENMRHDLRTPLSGIVGFANLIKEETEGTAIAEYADNLAASSNALLDYLNEILDVIRMASSEDLLIKQKFDLKSRLAEVIRLNQAKAAAKKINLHFTFDNAVPHYVVGDYKRLHRIALELVSNALTFTERGEVTLDVSLVEAKDERVVVKLSVTDTGIGIPQDKQQEIFTRFKKLTPSYKGIYHGLGLGLSIVKSFMDDLEGEIYVVSTLNHGTTFTCLIPFKKALVQTPDHCHNVEVLPLQEKTTSIRTNKKFPDKISSKKMKRTSSASSILLVEDNAIGAKITQLILEKLACMVDVANSAQQVAQYLQKKTYDLIFMDVGLPEIDGYEITRMIREQKLEMPIVALTAHVDIEHKQACIEAGMNAVLIKPLAKEKAEDILRAFIPLRKEEEFTASMSAKNTSPNDNFEQYPVLDINMAKTLITSDETVLFPMIKEFIDSIPQEVQQIKMAFKQKDFSKLSELAHKLKGSASYCGAHKLTAICAQLQTTKNIKNDQSLTKFYQALLKAMDELQKVGNSTILV